MLMRCRNQRVPGYQNYGGRGIQVCKEWLVFENFLSDMGEPPPGYSLDRLDVNSHYCPANCRWADRKTQNRNRRSVLRITIGGITLTAPEWEEKFGLKPKTIARRIRGGWDPVTAATTPAVMGQKIYPRKRST